MYVFIYIIRKDKNAQKKELGMKIYFFSSSPTAKTIWPVIIGCRPVTFRRFSIRPPFGFYVVSLSLSVFFIYFFFSSFSSFFATIRRNLVRFTHGDDWNEDAISTRLSPECSRRVFSSFCSAFFSNKFCT